MSARAVAIDHLLGAQQRLRERLGHAPTYARMVFAEAIREYSQAMMPIDVDRSLGLEELAAFVDPTQADRDREAVHLMTADERARPDKEGDEALLERRGVLRRWSDWW